MTVLLSSRSWNSRVMGRTAAVCRTLQNEPAFTGEDFAENAPFDLKDVLKARGYRWSDGSDGRPKSWWIEVAEEELEAELGFLRKEIYRWDEADPPTQRLTAFDRYSARR